MKIKLNLLIFFTLVLMEICYSQRIKKPQNLPRYDFKKVHFGFSLGINALNFNINYNPKVITNDSLYVLESQDQKGFNLGIVSNFRLGKYTDLRFIPALVFGERQLLYSFKKNENIETEKKIVDSTLIDFPLSVKYKSARYNNFRSYVLLGLKYSLDIASQEDIIDQDNIIIKLKSNDILGEVGFGMDFYSEFFKFSPEIKMSYGFINLLVNDESIYTKSIKRLYTKGWMISFTFE